MHLTPSAQLVINSGDRELYVPLDLSGTQFNNSGQTISQPYNNFLLNNPGQNIVQGSIDKIQVAEINFPYDIPTIIADWNGSLGFFYNSGANQFFVNIPTGFYTGKELATYMQTEINNECAAQSTPITGADIPQIVYDESQNKFTFGLATGATNTYVILPQDLYANGGIGQFFPPASVAAKYAGPIPKNLLSTMGFLPQNSNSTTGQYTYVLLAPNTSVKSGSAPLIFTQFIDIVSKALCGNVYITDGSTQRGGFRKDLLARLYISDEASSQSGYVYDVSGNPMLAPVGTRPFVIHRQFKNAKLIPNNLLNSLNTVDIQLMMDNGQPLPLGLNNDLEPRNFQITLNVFETDRTNTVNVPSSGYGNY